MRSPGTPLEFSIFRPDSTGAQKGNEDLVMPAELENVPRPRVSDNAQSGCIFVRSKRLSRAAKADVYYKIKYMSLDDATALAARIKAADALEDGAPPNDNSSTQSAQPEPDAPPPVAVAPHLEYPCSLRAIVEHLTHPHFVDRDDMFLTTFFYSCWCVSFNRRASCLPPCNIFSFPAGFVQQVFHQLKTRAQCFHPPVPEPARYPPLASGRWVICGCGWGCAAPAAKSRHNSCEPHRRTWPDNVTSAGMRGQTNRCTRAANATHCVLLGRCRTAGSGSASPAILVPAPAYWSVMLFPCRPRNCAC